MNVICEENGLKVTQLVCGQRSVTFFEYPMSVFRSNNGELEYLTIKDSGFNVLTIETSNLPVNLCGTTYNNLTDLYDALKFIANSNDGDTNLANTDLTLDDDRVHDGDGNSLRFIGNSILEHAGNEYRLNIPSASNIGQVLTLINPITGQAEFNQVTSSAPDNTLIFKNTAAGLSNDSAPFQAPLPDPEGGSGWYYKNTQANYEALWLSAGSDGTNTVADIETAWVLINAYNNTGTIEINLATQGGNNYFYTCDLSAVTGQFVLFYFGNDPIDTFPYFQHIAATFNPALSTGGTPPLPTEVVEIFAIYVTPQPINTVEFTALKAGNIMSGEKFQVFYTNDELDPASITIVDNEEDRDITFPSPLDRQQVYNLRLNEVETYIQAFGLWLSASKRVALTTGGLVLDRTVLIDNSDTIGGFEYPVIEYSDNTTAENTFGVYMALGNPANATYTYCAVAVANQYYIENGAPIAIGEFVTPDTNGVIEGFVFGSEGDIGMAVQNSGANPLRPNKTLVEIGTTAETF